MNKENYTNRFDVNNYLFNPEGRMGIYLIHGFSSTTYEVKKIAKHLASYGYKVKADNLPGHGTSIEDCNITKYTQWLSFVEKGIADMYSDCDKVIVVGVSMGAVLSLHIGTLFPIDGIVAASSVFRFKNEFNVRVLARLFHRFKPSVPKSSTFNPDKMKALNTKFYGYNQYPIYALNEMRKMVDKVKNKLHKISSPLLLIHSKADQTAPFENFEIVQKHLTTTQLETLILDGASHNLFDTDLQDKEKIFNSVELFIKNIFNAK